MTSGGGSPSGLEKTRAPGLVATIAAARHLAPDSDETCRAFPKTTLPSASNSNGIAQKLVDFLSTVVDLVVRSIALDRSLFADNHSAVTLPIYMVLRTSHPNRTISA